jgi:hypothetical protein
MPFRDNFDVPSTTSIAVWSSIAHAGLPMPLSVSRIGLVEIAGFIIGADRAHGRNALELNHYIAIGYGRAVHCYFLYEPRT